MIVNGPVDPVASLRFRYPLWRLGRDPEGCELDLQYET
jgi:hypothetical protein